MNCYIAVFFLHCAEEYGYFNNKVRGGFFWLMLLKLFLDIVAAFVYLLQWFKLLLKIFCPFSFF